MDDEIIAEVRSIKDAIAERYHYDLRALYVAIQRGEAELQAQGVKLISPPANPASVPPSAYQRTRFSRR